MTTPTSSVVGNANLHPITHALSAPPNPVGSAVSRLILDYDRTCKPIRLMRTGIWCNGQ